MIRWRKEAVCDLAAPPSALRGPFRAEDVGGRFSARRVGRSRQSERQQQRAAADAVAVVELRGCGDLAVADESAVLAPEILEPRVGIDDDARVPA